MRVYAYLRASTKKQDVERAKQEIADFCRDKKIMVSAWFFESESGTKLKRPELFKLLEIADKGDILLVEQVDRISRLNSDDWERLKREISDKGIKIMSLDLPTSHNLAKAGDEFTGWMLKALNSMILDMLAAISRKDYEDRRRRQKQGISKAKSAGKYKGRPPNQSLRDTIKALLNDGNSYGDIVHKLSCSKSTISRVKKELHSEL